MFNLETRFPSLSEKVARVSSQAESGLDRACNLFWQTAGKNETVFRILKLAWDTFGVPIRPHREAINFEEYQRHLVRIEDLEDSFAFYNNESPEPCDAFLDDGVVAPEMAKTIREKHINFIPNLTESSLN